MIPAKIAAKLAAARRYVSPLVKTEGARVYVPGSGRSAPTSVEWTYAPGHLVHEASAAALREVGLELFVAGFCVADTTIKVAFELVDVVDGGESWAWQSELPVDGGRVGATVAGAGALAMVVRHTRLTLLDIPCVPEEEARANRRTEAEAEARGRGDRRAAAVRPVMPPPPPREVEDEMPAWATPTPTTQSPVSEEEIAAVEAELAAEDAEIWKGRASSAWLEARARGAKRDLAEIFGAVFGPSLRRPDEMTAHDWRAVIAEIGREEVVGEA